MNKLLAHFRKMQAMSEAYITPADYVDRKGKTFPTYRGANPVGDMDRDQAFIDDMIYMLDGPEQREAEVEVDQRAEDMKLLIKSLMRDLLVADHVVTVEEPGGYKRTVVASQLIS